MGLPLFIYKMRLAKLIYKIYNDLTPLNMSHVIVKSDNKYNLRNANKVTVPYFETYYMKHSIAHRGSIVWNTLSPHMDVEKICNLNSYAKLARTNILHNIDFEPLSVQTKPQKDNVLKFY